MCSNHVEEVTVMFKNQNPVFDYHKEPSRDILCIDCKSFYASVECVSLGLDPLTTKLVVMSYPGNSWEERGSGLILASSPAAKKPTGSRISVVRVICPFLIPVIYILPHHEWPIIWRRTKKSMPFIKPMQTRVTIMSIRSTKVFWISQIV